MGLRPSKLFWSLVKKSSITIPKMMQRANHYIAAETLMVDKREEQKRPRAEQYQVGGPVIGGDSSSAHKAYARATIEKRSRRHPDPEISFRPEGEEYPNHDDALVIAVGREENRRGRPKPINHESPLLFIESYQKP
ncbi:hypothetical protein BHM03_00050464 [Ensete ventricosum]|nr:hypothetical protein BHM03_00050464 [Ensete ventricosum]